MSIFTKIKEFFNKLIKKNMSPELTTVLKTTIATAAVTAVKKTLDNKTNLSEATKAEIIQGVKETVNKE